MIKKSIIGLFIMLSGGLFAQDSFYENNITIELNIEEEVLKNVQKDFTIEFKLLSDLTDGQFKNWIDEGKNHYNVKSLKVLGGDNKKGYDVEITFLNGLDYATGKELFSGSFLVDYVVLNGEKLATNRFVSQKLTLNK